MRNRRTSWTWLIAGLLLTLASGRASAQYGMANPYTMMDPFAGMGIPTPMGPTFSLAPRTPLVLTHPVESTRPRDSYRDHLRAEANRGAATSNSRISRRAASSARRQAPRVSASPRGVAAPGTIPPAPPPLGHATRLRAARMPTGAGAPPPPRR